MATIRPQPATKNSEPVPSTSGTAVPSTSAASSSGSVAVSTSQYQQLLELEKWPLVHNNEPSECFLCHVMTPVGRGVVLMNCLHSFCTACLTASLLEASTVRCPYPNGEYGCEGHLEERELKALLSPGQYQEFSQRQLEAFQEEEMDDEEEEVEPSDLSLLVTMTDASVVPNPEPFDCPVCFVSYACYEGVILRDCFHCFCRECLVNSIKHADDVVIKCPFQEGNVSCDNVIQDREVKSLLSAEEYEKYLARSLRKAESLSENAFHCKSPDCAGWCLVDLAEVAVFDCPICRARNCLRCKAIHAGMNCEEYQDRLSGNYENRRSERALQNMVAAGEAMHCPKCNVVVMKTLGCDYIMCGMCKTGICWVTRGPRWGPLGQGDNSGGCRCKVNGIKCHPKCNNCH